jgi:hypothetical protein
MPEVAHVAEMIRDLERDNIILIRQTDTVGVENTFSSRTEAFAMSGMTEATRIANPETASHACIGLMRACSENPESVPGFRRHRDSTHLVIMAVPKKFFPAGRPISPDDIDDLLIDMTRAGIMPSCGVPSAWVRAAVDCRGGMIGIRENPLFEADRYDLSIPRKDLPGFPNLLIRPR